MVAANTSNQGLTRQFLKRDNPLSQDGISLKVTHLGVQFDGLLQVVDPARLLETIRDGVGSAKGFGYGLLSVARPPA